MKKYYNNLHFEISERKILLRFMDVVSVVLFLYFLSFSLNYKYFEINEDSFIWVFVIAVYLNFFGSIFEMYHLPIASFWNKIIKGVVLTSLLTVFFYFLTPFFTPSLPRTRSEVLVFSLSVFLPLLVWRLFYAFFIASKRFEKKIILVCNGYNIDNLMKDLLIVDPHIHILGFINLSNAKVNSQYKQFFVENIDSILEKTHVTEIVVFDPGLIMDANVYDKLVLLNNFNINVLQYDEIYEQITNRLLINKTNRDLNAFLLNNKTTATKFYNLIVRFFDVVFSVFGLLFLAVLIPFIFILNAIWNRGNLFYVQERIGKNGETFNIIKLRTMIKNAETEGAVFSQQNDVRITPFGKLMRRLRVDELPQFYNVVKNEMSLIGPRPERPFFVNQLKESLPIYNVRHIIKPGLTGWAQVNYTYGANLDDSLKKLQYDLYYIKNRNFFLDFNIVIKTLSTIIHFRGQ